MKPGLREKMNFDFSRIKEDFRRINNDPGTWPLIPRIVILLGVFILLLVLGWLLVWQGQMDDLARARQDETKLKSEFVEKKTLAVNLDAYLEQLQEVDRSFGILLKQLPNRSEVESLLVEVNQAGLGRGLQFELFKPAKENVKDFYAELPVAVKITGTYHDFGAFAADVAKLPRIVTLNDLIISPVPGAGGLVMEMSARTYRYLDESELQEIAKNKKEDKGKKGKKGSAKGSNKK